jgi:hypothetical protein
MKKKYFRFSSYRGKPVIGDFIIFRIISYNGKIISGQGTCIRVFSGLNGYNHNCSILVAGAKKPKYAIRLETSSPRLLSLSIVKKFKSNSKRRASFFI